MSEPHPAEPPGADVRSFLPRPGEPVEDYAARLRALHEDLSLVLDAVERGLAAAEADTAAPPPVPPPVRSVEVPREPHRSPPPQGVLTAPRGHARVEVVSTPATARVEHEHEGGRAWSGPSEPEGAAPRRRAPLGEGVAARGEPAAPSPVRWTPEPWVERAPAPARAEPWVERTWPPPPSPPAEMSFAPPPHAPFAAPPRRRVAPLPPLFVAAAVLGWLTVLALVIALAFGL